MKSDCQLLQPASPENSLQTRRQFLKRSRAIAGGVGAVLALDSRVLQHVSLVDRVSLRLRQWQTTFG